MCVVATPPSAACTEKHCGAKVRLSLSEGGGGAGGEEGERVEEGEEEEEEGGVESHSLCALTEANVL